jgi:hypothetical protein
VRKKILCTGLTRVAKAGKDLVIHLSFIVSLPSLVSLVYPLCIAIVPSRKMGHTYYRQREKLAPTFPEAEFLEKIQTKVLRVFLLAIYSHLSTALPCRFLFLKTHATSYSFYSTLLRRNEEHLIENHTPFPMS